MPTKAISVERLNARKLNTCSEQNLFRHFVMDDKAYSVTLADQRYYAVEHTIMVKYNLVWPPFASPHWPHLVLWPTPINGTCTSYFSIFLVCAERLDQFRHWLIVQEIESNTQVQNFQESHTIQLKKCTKILHHTTYADSSNNAQTVVNQEHIDLVAYWVFSRRFIAATISYAYTYWLPWITPLIHYYLETAITIAEKSL